VQRNPSFQKKSESMLPIAADHIISGELAMNAARRFPWLLAALFVTTAAVHAGEPAAQLSSTKPKRILLIGDRPDGHPWNTHEYMAGQRILAACLKPVKDVQVTVVNGNEPWANGPELIDRTDVAVVFVSQGARWLQKDKRRLAAFRRLAKRHGGLVALHWGMGAQDAKYIPAFRDLFGGIHGGPDRKYKVLTTTTELAAPQHPILRGVKPVKVKEEFYYTLKLTKSGGKLTPLIRVPIDGKKYTVAFAWERPDGGRSFCFSGLHFHTNWKRDAYRRMVTQAVLWTAGVDVPKGGLPLKYDMKDMTQPRPKPVTKN
jgi:type 1 glutamine amidotransferase